MKFKSICSITFFYLLSGFSQASTNETPDKNECNAFTLHNEGISCIHTLIEKNPAFKEKTLLHKSALSEANDKAIATLKFYPALNLIEVIAHRDYIE